MNIDYLTLNQGELNFEQVPCEVSTSGTPTMVANVFGKLGRSCVRSVVSSVQQLQMTTKTNFLNNKSDVLIIQSNLIVAGNAHGVSGLLGLLANRVSPS